MIINEKAISNDMSKVCYSMSVGALVDLVLVSSTVGSYINKKCLVELSPTDWSVALLASGSEDAYPSFLLPLTATGIWILSLCCFTRLPV